MKISIFTPTNNGSYLQEVYASIKAQPFDEWIIVHNGGSKPIEFNDARVKQFSLPIALDYGVGPLKAYACEQATGDVLLELDHDDLLMPTAVAEVQAAFEDEEIGLAYSNTIHATGDFKKRERFGEVFGWKYREVEFQGHALDEFVSFAPTPDSLSRVWFAPDHLRAYRRSVYEAVGGHARDMRVLDDHDLTCRMYLKTKFKHIDKGLYIYRVHGENSWLKNNAEIQNNAMRIHDLYAESLVERWSDLNGLRKLELGAGKVSKEGYETVDLKDAEIIADLNKPWPFADSSVGAIRAYDVFEHLLDSIHTMKEAARVLAPGGWLFCQVPSTDGRGAFQDPTHVSFWNENSFHYYTKEAKAKYIDTPVRFQAPRLYTTDRDAEQVCWVRAHLINLKNGYRPAGLVEI